MSLHKEISKLWPSKWSATLAIDCEKKSNSVESVIDTLSEFSASIPTKGDPNFTIKA